MLTLMNASARICVVATLLNALLPSLLTAEAGTATAPPASQQAENSAAAVAVDVEDRIRDLQAAAEIEGRAAWGHWGDQPDRYVSWSNHSNRLIPVYTFGMTLSEVAGDKSPYRDERRLRELYGRDAEWSLNPQADYFDQTDVQRLQLMAADTGKKQIVLFVFDGMDWHTTRTAAIAASGVVAYSEGRGTGFAFQDYRGAVTDFGCCVTSPANDGTKFDVDAQVVRNPGGERPGGYDATRGGSTAWDTRVNLRYLIGRDRDRAHAVTDSAASATALCSGRKTYNDGINVDVKGAHLVPVARTLQARGWAVGAVSSVPVSHATPACAYANNVSRDDYQDIARDMLGQPSIAHRDHSLPGLDVLIGGGCGVRKDVEKDQGRNFEPGNKYVADSTLAAIDVSHGGGYRVATRTPGRRGGEVLAEAAADAVRRKLRLFGFFGTAEGNLPLQTADGDFEPAGGLPASGEIDPLRQKYGSTIHYSEADITENPTLADMARAALDVLSSRGNFWLMVEAGDVDWASHANNIDTSIGAVRSGDAAFRAVVDWIERRSDWKDTVVIVTSDHGHMFVLTEPEAFASPAD